MKKRLVIEYDQMEDAVGIVENDFTTFEAFGVIEAAKMMITDAWFERTEGKELD